MARASTETLLALDRFARIMGITPPHFNQACGAVIFPISGGCNSIWYQYSWQRMDQVGREDLALEISAAENEIARQLGYWPAPRWTYQELRLPTYFHRRDMDWQKDYESVRVEWGKVISGGRRGLTLVASPATVFSDPDGDGYNELATVTCATTLTDPTDLKLYFAGHSGEPEWEIRPLKTAVVAAGVFTATLDAWLLLDPDLWEAFPTTATMTPIVLTTAANYVAAVDVYREYNDPSQVSAAFYWRNEVAGCAACGGTGCASCEYTTQNGCLSVRDWETGQVCASPATYSGGWTSDDWTVCDRAPDILKLWYYSGEIDQKWLKGRARDPLPDWWAQAISWLAVARLERPLCSCGAASTLAKHLQEDLAAVGEVSHSQSMDELDNPFGARRGEVMAWRRVAKFGDRQWGGAMV